MAANNSAAKTRRASSRKRSGKLRAVPKIENETESWIDEIAAVACFVLALFLLVSFVSFKLSDQSVVIGGMQLGVLEDRR
ncbi:MAG: hypothetical protein KDD42_09815, partial [Bdellovibrionales bacterium]|nr:hypothetical protein [Bdellovibrionales bacterium]